MKTHTYRTAMGILIAALLPLAAAHAQLGDLLKGGGTGGLTSGLGNLGGAAGALSGQSLPIGSASNVAGVLEFCVKNNYLSGNSVSSVKDSLLSKVSGNPASSSKSDYSNGAKGILSNGNGKLDLSGGGLKAQITKQVCDKVLASGKSML